MARPTVITIHGTYLKLDGTPEQGIIFFRSRTFSSSSQTDNVMVPSILNATLAEDGSVSIQVPATNDPEWSPVGWTYEFNARLTESATTYFVTVPYDADSGMLNLSQLLPVPPAGGNLYSPYNHTHTGYVTETEVDALVDTAVTGVVDDAIAEAVANLGNDFAPTVHTHTEADVVNLTIDLAAKAPLNSPAFTGTVSGISKSMVGLGNVDNTSDTSKPVSTAQQTALNLKASLVSPTFTGTVSGITKAMVGLANIDNTTDSGKPISNAAQTALDLKAPLANPVFTGTVTGVDKAAVGLNNVDNTADTAKPISSLTQTALNLKAPIASPSFTGTVSGVTKSMVGLSNVDNTADTSKPISTATQTALNAKTDILVLGPAAAVPGGTRTGTVIVRTVS